MYPQYHKVKSASKQISYGSPLQQKVISTLETIANVVGGTLGPGGKPVLIERYEPDLPPIVTKDGVTVFKNLGFEDTTAQTILECARDVAIKTAASAGDGTTTATLLSYAFVKNIYHFCEKYPQESPQKIIREIETIFQQWVEPFLKKISLKVDRVSSQNRKVLWGVANVSANFDEKLADAVMECFDLVGNEGNVTLVEGSGPTSYQVEKIKGYMIGQGYEETCLHFYPKFVNDIQNQRVELDHPFFLLYYGKITEMGILLGVIEKLLGSSHKNVVVIATGFSDQVIGQLAYNFAEADTKKIYPLVAPLSQQINGQLDLFLDLSAITGATVFDPINRRLDGFCLTDLGPGVEFFESHRFRSTVVGYATGPILERNPALASVPSKGTYEDLLFLRIDELKGQLQSPESQHDRILLQERLAKITDGIAKLKVIGSSNGEIKEKKDRAEDAICAVRGAIQQGCLPGGAYSYELLKDTLAHTVELTPFQQKVNEEVLAPAFSIPFHYLLENAGLNAEERDRVYQEFEEYQKKLSIQEVIKEQNFFQINPWVYNILSQSFVPLLENYLLDSTPAVLEAIRNAISIASVLGTLGGAVVFSRNLTLENQEASKTIDFLKSAGSY